MIFILIACHGSKALLESIGICIPNNPDENLHYNFKPKLAKL